MTLGFEYKVEELIINNKTVYCPAYVIDGKVCMISHQDVLVYFETKEEAEEFINEEF